MSALDDEHVRCHQASIKANLYRLAVTARCDVDGLVFVLNFSISLWGSLAKGVLRKVCGNAVETSQELTKNTCDFVRKGYGNSAESLRNFAEICSFFLL